MEKTNAIRLLEAAGIEFEVREYPVDEEDLSAVHAATMLGLDPDSVFKTIVLRGDRIGPFVCVIPGPCEVDLKKAAKAAGDKSASPLPLKELEPLTGYLRGGFSPIGMKRKFPTFIDETALLFDRISVSAGRRGLQALLSVEDLKRVTGSETADLI
ncbi:MAG: aminoacyl-tRNA deacylase [Treponema sp. GWB1_62_6]|nr:MAG: aminoacyl-tRNA deacylase [Treponema sp. GWB1_62_6]OHE67365.1 MAG: aminoacyl-tRNA deacylase [Treponema sp. GWC1_61_84]OHE76018.1 MAG: aminoacyl-tRNA deacylase [Treponema sp. RIFOXYC1_FULL_61_9]HCM27454.1 Cys-tRNA(Pro) deacylase [Treponema sp.]